MFVHASINNILQKETNILLFINYATSSDGVKGLNPQGQVGKATAKDYTYKATGNKIKIKQQSIHLQ